MAKHMRILGPAEQELETIVGHPTEAVEPPRLVGVDLGRGFNTLIHEFEARLLYEAMRLAHGNQVQAAKLLKINRSTLQYKLKKIAHPSLRAVKKDAA